MSLVRENNCKLVFLGIHILLSCCGPAPTAILVFAVAPSGEMTWMVARPLCRLTGLAIAAVAKRRATRLNFMVIV